MPKQRLARVSTCPTQLRVGELQTSNSPGIAHPCPVPQYHQGVYKIATYMFSTHFRHFNLWAAYHAEVPNTCKTAFSAHRLHATSMSCSNMISTQLQHFCLAHNSLKKSCKHSLAATSDEPPLKCSPPLVSMTPTKQCSGASSTAALSPCCCAGCVMCRCAALGCRTSRYTINGSNCSTACRTPRPVTADPAPDKLDCD